MSRNTAVLVLLGVFILLLAYLMFGRGASQSNQTTNVSSPTESVNPKLTPTPSPREVMPSVTPSATPSSSTTP